MFKDQICGQPDLSNVPSSIIDNERATYFRGCVGAIDGSHIPLTASGIDMGPWSNRKQGHSQNVMLACDFEMRIFLYSQLTRDQRTAGLSFGEQLKGFRLPSSHYVLADGGYSKKNRMLLVAYQRTRYHLREIADAQRRPQTAQELFNLRHARLKNVIERLIGVMKKCWRILRDGPEIGF